MPRKLRKRVKARRRKELRPFAMLARTKAAVTAADDAPGEDGKPKLGTFKGVAYTGAVMEPGGWYGRIVVDLAGVRVPKPQRPALHLHDHTAIVGHCGVEVTETAIEVEGVFSGQPEHTEKVTVPAGNGFEWELSIGCDPVRTEFLEAGEDSEVNGQTVTGPLTISRETVLGEVSFVPLGADGDTSVSVAANRRGFTRRRAKSSLKYKDGPAPPGKPPHVHRSSGFTKPGGKKGGEKGGKKTQPASPLRELTFFAYDPVTKSVVIGPALGGPRSGAPETVEEGGTARVDGHTVTIRPRPWVRPAFLIELKAVGKDFKDSLKG